VRRIAAGVSKPRVFLDYHRVVGGEWRPFHAKRSAAVAGQATTVAGATIPLGSARFVFVLFCLFIYLFVCLC
jgi:hypothetical protein